ncbi:GNAT family N-acetyltransferase [Pararhizobium sp. PWRC1-1]|uniref:GNAT family N-acetyltransferase n=1 Tax=Pararhizobium sp. PWRC1-1 TaxID=2804566 RepID=UPI003CF0D02D
MTAAANSHGLTFRQDYFGDPPAWAALVALLEDTFGIDVSIQDRFGGPDPTSMPFGYFDESGVSAANFSGFSMPMMVDGRLVKAAGFQSGAVRPQWRGQGLYRDLMNRAFGWCDEQGFELGILLTDKPAMYEPYGFRVLPQQRFLGAPPPAETRLAGTVRELSLDNAGDITLIRRVLRERTPVSSVFAATAQAEMFLLNGFFDPDVRLTYLDQFEAVIAWKEDETSFQLLDIAGKTILPLSAILGSFDRRPDRVEVFFPPDRLDWQGTQETFESDISLMVRGSAAGLSGPVMLSPMAEF